MNFSFFFIFGRRLVSGGTANHFLCEHSPSSLAFRSTTFTCARLRWFRLPLISYHVWILEYRHSMQHINSMELVIKPYYAVNHVERWNNENNMRRRFVLFGGLITILMKLIINCVSFHRNPDKTTIGLGMVFCMLRLCRVCVRFISIYYSYCSFVCAIHFCI